VSRRRGGPGGGSRSPRGGGAGVGRRRAAERVRSARSRKAGSTRWLQRHINDPFVHEARRHGYRARAAFKLLELDDRFGFLKPGARVVDLGAAPGGWTQVAVERVRPGDTRGRVVALDALEVEPVPGAEVIQADFLEPDAPETIKTALDGAADVVLSDLSPDTTGHKPTDHRRIVLLVEAAWVFAQEVLAPGGTFVAKVFRGGTEGDVLDELKRSFRRVRHVKPEASRKESPEIYVVATGYKGE